MTRGIVDDHVEVGSGFWTQPRFQRSFHTASPVIHRVRKRETTEVKGVVESIKVSIRSTSTTR
jgi:hypothetical protein